MVSEAITCPDGGISTRERILREASHLFAARGYYGTSTREIATVVGIRQPSLFHHFESKRSIFQVLLDYSLEPSIVVARYLADVEGSPAARLYRFLVEDFKYLMNSPYDLRGIFNDDVLLEDDFVHWHGARIDLHELVAGLVKEAIDAGEFIDVGVSFTRQAISGLMLETIRERSLGEKLPTQRPLRTANFVTRALLVDPSKLDVVAAQAAAIDGVPPYGGTE